MSLRTRMIVALALVFFLGVVRHDGNAAAPLPPPGIEIGAVRGDTLKRELKAFGSEIEALRLELADKPELARYLPDVEVFHKAVRYPLEFDEFYKTNEADLAEKLIVLGRERIAQLRKGESPWIWATGLVVRGYRSRIDGSVQPFGLVVPEGYQYQDKPRRLDVWLAGRNDKRTELAFLGERMKSRGEFAPPETIVLHPYGRYCNAYKFAGETDVFEAMETVMRDYDIDPLRIAIRGFSMGGAGTWHLGVHHAGIWAGVAPGAGFADTARYLELKVTPDFPPPWEQTLWHLYDSADDAGNLFNTTPIAYSGEIDPQRLAADTMAAAMTTHGLTLRHLIGPKTAHKYEPATKVELAQQFDAVMAQGRVAVPSEIRFDTYTLRYDRMGWVQVDGLEHHWKRATMDARLKPGSSVEVSTTNVTALTLAFPEEQTALAETVTVVIDGDSLKIPGARRDHRWTASFAKTIGHWGPVDPDLKPTGLHKRHGLQGPIDDAFMDSFLIVVPSGKAQDPKVESWVERELKRAREQWRTQFRGEPRVKRDNEVTDADLAANNLVLWGDPQSNSLLGRIADQLPIRWTKEGIEAGARKVSSAGHALVMICPNPLSPSRYVVLNSGFTFRGFGSNADQTPKLPDWALVDVTQPATARAPGGVDAAGFFDENWQLKK
jgi:pimeloyl-ACP methyl ester carboxylesterase